MGKKGKKGSKKKKAKKIIEEPRLIRQLVVAAALGDLEDVKKIFDLPPHEKKMDLGQSASESYWQAAKHGHQEVVSFILDQGCDINLQSGKALHMASEGGHLNVVQYLVERGADINMGSYFHGWTALHYASKEGHLVIVDYLVRNGAVLGLKSHGEHNGTYSGWAALHFAADEGHLAVCQFLVEVGKCIIDLPNSVGETSLSLAAEHGCFKVVQYLVTAGANIHATRRGLNIVQWAIYRCVPDMVQFLVSYGAKANMNVKCLWFPSDLTLQEVIKRQLSEPVYDKMDIAIYRGSVRLQERANHMRVLSEITWEEGPLYDPINGEEMAPSGEVNVIPRAVLHLISAYEL